MPPVTMNIAPPPSQNSYMATTPMRSGTTLRTIVPCFVYTQRIAVICSLLRRFDEPFDTTEAATDYHAGDRSNPTFCQAA